MEGTITEAALGRLREGLEIQGRFTLPAEARALPDPGLPERQPPIRVRQSIPTAWLEISLREGRNRQVRRMTAAIGLPTLRLVRVAMDLEDGGTPLSLQGLAAGQWRWIEPDEERRLARLLQGAGRRAASGAHRSAAGRRGRFS